MLAAPSSAHLTPAPMKPAVMHAGQRGPLKMNAFTSARLALRQEQPWLQCQMLGLFWMNMAQASRSGHVMKLKALMKMNSSKWQLVEVSVKKACQCSLQVMYTNRYLVLQLLIVLGQGHEPCRHHVCWGSCLTIDHSCGTICENEV